VNPDLVVLDKEGKPYSVRYDQESITRLTRRISTGDLSFFRRNLAFLADHNFFYPFDPQNPR
jgi:hypothetical protein